MNDVTRMLSAMDGTDQRRVEQVLTLVYDELRKLAAQRLRREQPGQTLDATGLVHEAYLKLVGTDREKPWDGRGHFFAAAAEAMRRILIDRARDRLRLKRGGGSRNRHRVDLKELIADDASPDELIDLDEALTRLSSVDARAANLVKLRLFAGLSLDEAATALGVVRRTAQRDWTFARAWLFEQLSASQSS
jgi:RNA polymerase sigma factor (TIGR02999 family)